tara:strand:- start:452 stop:553 length:102 start_codon:yes stop_codon:yes gene_type:complete
MPQLARPLSWVDFLSALLPFWISVAQEVYTDTA